MLCPGPDVPERINLAAPPHIEHGKLTKLHTLATGVCLFYLGINPSQFKAVIGLFALAIFTLARLLDCADSYLLSKLFVKEEREAEL